MKIAFIHPTRPGREGAGSTQSATQLIEGLSVRGHDVVVYCGSPPDEHRNEQTRHVPADGVGSTSLGKRVKMVRGLERRIEEFTSFDIVHSYTSRAIPALATIGDETDAATVAVLNSYGAICPKKDLFYLNSERCTENGIARCTNCLFRSKLKTEDGVYDGKSLYERYDGLSRIPVTGYMLARQFESLWLSQQVQECADRLDGYHAQSPHMKETYAEFGFPEESIHIVPNILDERFSIPHESGFTSPYRLLYVGSLAKKKGVFRLIPILDTLNASTADEFQLTVAGTGAMRSVMEKEARSRDLEDKVNFAGHVKYSNLPELYATHDVFIYPGVWDEPFARVFLESLATGTPFVGSNVGDVREIFGPAGRITDGSVEGFTESLLEIVRNDDFGPMSEAAKERAKRYESDQVLSQLEDMYELII